jgi:hypothetical protein
MRHFPSEKSNLVPPPQLYKNEGRDCCVIATLRYEKRLSETLSPRPPGQNEPKTETQRPALPNNNNFFIVGGFRETSRAKKTNFEFLLVLEQKSSIFAKSPRNCQQIYQPVLYHILYIVVRK